MFCRSLRIAPLRRSARPAPTTRITRAAPIHRRSLHRTNSQHFSRQSIMSAATATAAATDAKSASSTTATAAATATGAAAPFVSRQIDKYIESKAQAEGVGATVRRSIGGPQLRNFDPFLMLDEFSVAAPAGFPDHPHRGFETVTYMIDGAFEHEDFCGHRGLIESGDLQWMTAGRGILHSEMPAPTKAGAKPQVSHGLQLWVNLAAKDKLCEPAYQELKSSEITTVKGAAGTPDAGVTAIVIAGSALGHTSKVYTRNPTSYVHFKMEPNSRLQHIIPAGHNAFVYTLNGSGYFGGSSAAKRVRRDAHHVMTLTPGKAADGLIVETDATAGGLDFVLLTGQPINEPVVQHGPFVMNSQAEIYKAMQDYQSASNGFERAVSKDGKRWKSEIGKPITDKYGHDDDDEL